MIKSLCLFLFTIIFQNTFSQHTLDPKQLELNGNVKSMIEIDYKDESKKNINGYILISEFNQNGILTKYKIYNQKNVIRTSRSYYYEKDKKDSINSLEDKNKDKKPTTKRKIDSNQNLTSKTELNNVGAFISEERYEYNDANLLISTKKYLTKDTLRYTILYFYDSFNNIIKRELLNSEGEILGINLYKNKRKLRRSEIRLYKGKKSVYEKRYKYNHQKKIKKMINYSFLNNSTTKTYYKYNENDMVIKETIVKQNGDMSYYTFKYDNENNWIELKYYKNKNKTAKDIMTREFEYY